MKTNYDAAIIGGGASGMLAAIYIARAGHSCIIYEATKQLGSKILISGGGHCNLTNTSVKKEHFNSTRLNSAFNIIKSFDNNAVLDYFTSHTVSLTADEAGRVLPRSDDARTIHTALSRELTKHATRIYTSCPISRIIKGDDLFYITHPGGTDTAHTVIIATGGKSYPHTGSTGDGYRFAREFGHSCTPLAPGLSAIKITGHPLRSLEGISLVATLTLWIDNTKCISYTGDLLITHDGISGPVALNMSRHCAYAKKGDATITVSFFQKLLTEKMIIEIATATPKKHVRTFLREHLPNRLADHILAATTIPKETVFATITKTQRKHLCQLLTAYALPVASVHGYDRAEVTAGGIPLDELRTKTLESKKVPGLFFAGEVCDVDGIMGGYNLQWAWSSGVAAACGINTWLEEKR